MRAREGISYKTLVVKGYLGWGGAGEFPTGHIPLSSIFIQICFLHWNQSRVEKKLQYPHDHVTANSCKTPNGNGKTAGLSEW